MEHDKIKRVWQNTFSIFAYIPVNSSGLCTDVSMVPFCNIYHQLHWGFFKLLISPR